MQPGRGIALKLVAVTLFIVMASLIKATADDVPPGEAVFFRSFFAMWVILAWLALRGDLRTGLRVQRPMGHFWRGVIGTGAMGFGFAGLGLLPLPEVTAIGYASPLITVIFAALLLGERVRLFRLSAVGLGLVGVLIVLSPRLSLGGGAGGGGAGAGDLAALGAVLVLISATLRALAQIHIRKLAQVEQTSAIVFYFSATATLLSLLTAPFGWAVPGWGDALMLVAAGLIGGVAQIFLTSAYRFADASVLAPFDYASMLLAIAIGYAVFGEVPTPVMLSGAALIMLAGGLIIWRERQLGLKRGRARAGLTPQG